MARTRTYNPGRPTLAVQAPNGLFIVESFRGQEAAYQVDPAAGTCTCPHFTQRLAGTGELCKHGQAVRLQQQWARLEEKARLATDQQLEALLPKYEQAGKLEVAVAIRSEMLNRGQQVPA